MVGIVIQTLGGAAVFGTRKSKETIQLSLNLRH